MRNTYILTGLVLSALLAAVGCSPDGDSDENSDAGGDTDVDSGADDAGAEGAGAVAFATYNAGLAVGFVDYAEERLPLVGAGLAALEADVVCLQEVWLSEHIDALVAASKDTFPHAHYEMTEDDMDAGSGDAGSGDPACTEEEIDNFGGCVRDHCSDVDPGELTTCALGNCAAEFAGLSSECTGCVAANIGGTIDEILEVCSGSGGGSMAYEGHNGLLMLSKHAIEAKETLVFKSFLNRRVLLHAQIETPDLGQIDLFCTHLTAALSAVEYAGEYDSWEDEQAAQISEMLSYIDEHKSAANPVVLMGDMNCGPQTGIVSAEFAENYQLFVDGGFTAPYVDDVSSPCTWCGENPLTGGGDSGGVDSIIDHVLVKQMPEGATYETERILDDAVSFESEGAQVDSRRSDHYGAKVVATK